jgi:hypothetical protein
MAWVRLEDTAIATPPEVAAKVGAISEVPGGYGELLSVLPRMKPTSVGGIQDVLTICATGRNVIVFHPGLTLRTLT